MYTIKVSQVLDCKMNRDAFEKVTAFMIWKSASCKIIDHTKYTELAATGLINKGIVEPGYIAIIARTEYANEYSATWSELRNCISDFISGYEACEEYYKMLLSWDEAIVENKTRKQWLKKAARSFDIEDDGSIDTLPDIADVKRISYRRNNIIRVHCSCTGPELEKIKGEVSTMA